MDNHAEHNSTKQQRVVRVFISSTFRDMHAEREELVKFAFPKLRKLCRERQVDFVDVDLRWGLTDEQKAEGKVLPICLAEIERCHPYFIGVLGERYGWVPDNIDKGTEENQPWLKKHNEKSVTELEILHGVLKNPEMEKQSFFYFRDPETSKCVEEELAKEHDYKKEPHDSYSKLKLLKREIVAQESNYPVPVRINYPDVKTFGQMVLEDMWGVIDNKFPVEKVPTALELERMEHAAYADGRRKVYIGREEYYRQLNDHVDSESLPLVILGESGSGKSALIANWAVKYRKEHPDDFLLTHFIGASPYSADWVAMLRRIMSELKERFDLLQDIPDKPEELRAVFANWLSMAGAKGRVILILDALNQLEDRDGARDLVWLPTVIPINIRVILSTLPGKPLKELKKRDWMTLKVEPITQDERRTLIEKYLAQYTKTLSHEHSERVASAEQTSNPLYLQALLEELRVFGIYELLDKKISYYLEADTLPDLYGKILTRYEEDYNHVEKPQLVEETMSCIWAARRGLMESELLDILGKDDSPIPRAIWSPLYLAAEHSLINRSGFIGFSHDYLRKAVFNTYLSAEEKQKAAHIRLAEYFATQNLTVRRIDEHAWQLARAKEWKSLSDLLVDLNFLAAMHEASPTDTKTNWAEIEANSPLRMVDAYEQILASPRPEVNHTRLCIILGEMGYLAEASSLSKYLVNNISEMDEPGVLANHLGNRANILIATGNLEEAMTLLQQKERICNEHLFYKGLLSCYSSQAAVLNSRGDHEGALQFSRKQESLARTLKDRNALQIALGNQGLILAELGHLEEAMTLHKEEERICRELGDAEMLQGSIGNQATIYSVIGNYDKAMALFREKETICRALGNRKSLAIALGNQANILARCYDYVAAMELYKEQETITRAIGHPEGTATSMMNQAVTLADDLHRLSEGLALAQQAAALAIDHGLYGIAAPIQKYVAHLKSLSE